MFISEIAAGVVLFLALWRSAKKLKPPESGNDRRIKDERK